MGRKEDFKKAGLLFSQKNDQGSKSSRRRSVSRDGFLGRSEKQILI